jgi:UDP-N-acetylmuramoylalanine--D-glutamate ligase
MGAGLSGEAATELLLGLGAQVTVSDRRSHEQLGPVVSRLQALGVRFIDEDSAFRTILNFDLVITSPGVAKNHPVMEKARKLSIKVVGEIELAFRYLDIPVIAITGSNGKTSVTELTGHILHQCGLKVFVGGNIGNPLARFVSDKIKGSAPEADWAVLEISSFQLETIEYFKARAAAFLNLTPDHLDRHETLAEYLKMKSRVFNRQDRKDLAVFNLDDEYVKNIAVNSTVFGFSRTKRPDFGAFGHDGLIEVVKGSELLAQAHWSEFQLSGGHNMENVMAAVGLAGAADLSAAEALKAAKSFVAGNHRLKTVAEIDGVLYVDDSKGTNVGAVAAAIESFQRPIILILGGRDKDLDFQYLVPYVQARVKKLILIGECRQKIRRSLGHLVPTEEAESMAETVSLAQKSSQRGDVVLLSPACASFDMFRDYKERGDVFAGEVKKLKG